MKNKVENKTTEGKIELKFAANAEDDTITHSFSGYGAVFGNQDDNGDVVAPGTFSKSLAAFKASGTMPAMLWNHDSKSMPIGVWNDISEDLVGLKVAGTFLDTTSGEDAYKVVKAGAITGLSIGFIVTGFEISRNNGKVNRLITEVKLLEISIVTFPANTSAQIADVKSFDDEDEDDDCNCDDPDRDPDDDDNCDCDDETYSMLIDKGYDPKATKTFLATTKSTKSEDDEPSDDDDDNEDDAETKYNHEAAMAVKNLCLKLKQERYGR